MSPDRPHIEGLMADTMTPEERVTDYINRMKERWGQETGQPWDNTGPQIAFFYNILKKRLLTEAQIMWLD